MTQVALIDRHSALAEEIAGLEREAGAALLDGGSFDAMTLVAKHAELAAMEAAEAEERRREHAALVAAEFARRRVVAREITETLPFTARQ